MISGASGASGSSSAAGASLATAAGSAAAGAPLPALEWKFSQVFGERAIGEEVQEGTWLDRWFRVLGRDCFPRDKHCAGLALCRSALLDLRWFILSALRILCSKSSVACWPEMCGFFVVFL